MSSAVCLLSGGLDSTTAFYWALREGYEVTALTIHYGQLHAREIEFARFHAAKFSLPHTVLNVPFTWKGSALLDSSVSMPVLRDDSAMNADIPATYVPARNTVFLSLAASCAEACGAGTILIGANILDYSGYPDCRPKYFQAFETMLKLGTRAGQEGRPLVIKAPLLKMSKREIVELGARLEVPFEQTWSCYQGGDTPCGICDSCILRAKGFEQAGLKDPLLTHAASRHR